MTGVAAPLHSFDAKCVGSPVTILLQKEVNKLVYNNCEFPTRVSTETSWSSAQY